MRSGEASSGATHELDSIFGTGHDFSRIPVHAKAPPSVPPKLAVGEPDDECEREADRVADEVIRMPASLSPSSHGRNLYHHAAAARAPLPSGARDRGARGIVRRAVHPPSGLAPGFARAVMGVQGGGRPLNEQERSYFEPRFGADFSEVRIHDDSRADRAARVVGARAYTLGTDVVLRSGAYDTSAAGRHLMAHELTHVVQQQARPGRGVIQRKRDPDLVHDGYHTFYLRTGANARELVVQFHYSGSGSSVTVKIAHQPSTPNMREGTFQLSSGATFAPTILTEAQGVTTFDLDGDDSEDVQVLTSVEDYTVRLPTTGSTPASLSTQSFAVRDVYMLAQFGGTKLVVEAPGQGLPEEAIWAPRWRMASHPDPRIRLVWQDTRTSRQQIPPVGASMGGLNQPPSFIRTNLPIASRSSWGARPPITNDPDRSYETYTAPLASVYDSIVIHHAGNAGHRTMSEVQDLHMDEKERADIGYHFGIGLSGRVYTGRPLEVKGAHVVGANTGKIGIVLMADLDAEDAGVLIDFSDDAFTDRMQASLIRLIEDLRDRFPGILYLGGHKEFDTSRNCPGSLTMDRMDTLRSVTELAAPP